MINFVHKLRGLPIKERRNILHFSMIVLSLIVFGLWTLTLQHNLNSTEAQIQLQRSMKPFEDLSSQVAGTYDAFNESNEDNINQKNIINLKSTIENGQR